MPVPAWLGSVAAGVLSAGGEIWANNATNRSTKAQMDFQERMSSTAAQRAVKDYAAAGLNPALAYDRPASSPSGASTQFGNPAEKGINSAMAAKQLQAQLALTNATTKKMTAEAEKADIEAGAISGRLVLPNGTPTYADQVAAERSGRMRDIAFEGKFQPGELRQQALRNLLLKLESDIVGPEAAYSKKAGLARPLTKDLLGAITQITGSASGAANILRSLRIDPGTSETVERQTYKGGSFETRTRRPIPRSPRR